GRTAGVLMHEVKKQSGQVMVIVAVWLIALIGSAALILLTGSVEWQRNQSQQLADQAALDAALKIGVGCTAGSASTVITEADNFVATQRTRTGGRTIGAGTCSGGYAGTYSDLGDTSVYANGQSWVGGGGLCVAGANTGSTNSVCADGYEVSGHNATTCGASGTSAFLSAGNAAINANPCAAGTGPQPVAPVSTALPPEPNTDPAAIATLRNNAGGPLGAACNPAGVYPNITAGG